MNERSPAPARASVEEQLVLDVITAMLAVNRWTLERAFTLAGSLREEGFASLGVFANLSVEEVAERLRRAGFRRGSFTERLLAERIRDAAERLQRGDLHRLLQLEREGDRDGMTRLLMTFNGVGPDVANSFLALRS